MTEEQYMHVLSNPYWCKGSPLDWQADGVGLAYFARNGQVGRFNLCYLMMQRNHPPRSGEAYRQANLQWVIMLAGGTNIRWSVGSRTYSQSIEHCAAMMTLRDFSNLILPLTENRSNLAIPWATLNAICKGVLA